jgi:hypothetical protein
VLRARVPATDAAAAVLAYCLPGARGCVLREGSSVQALRLTVGGRILPRRSVSLPHPACRLPPCPCVACAFALLIEPCNRVCAGADRERSTNVHQLGRWPAEKDLRALSEAGGDTSRFLPADLFEVSRSLAAACEDAASASDAPRATCPTRPTLKLPCFAFRDRTSTAL